MGALQHVAGLQAVQEPLHQGHAPATTTTYNRTTEFGTKFQCFRISIILYELGSRFFFKVRILSPDTGCFLKYKSKSKQKRYKLLKVKPSVADPGCLPRIPDPTFLSRIQGWKNPRSQIRIRIKESVLRIRIRYPVPFWPLDSGSGIGLFRIPDPKPIFLRA